MSWFLAVFGLESVFSVRRVRDVSNISHINRTSSLCAGVFFATVWGTKSDVKVSKMGVQWPQNGAFGGQKWAKSGPKWSPKGGMEKHLKKYPKNVVLARFWAP